MEKQPKCVNSRALIEDPTRGKLSWSFRRKAVVRDYALRPWRVYAEPYWASEAGRSHDMVTLVDDKHGDGVEAWVNLNEKDMHVFEKDEDILEITSARALPHDILRTGYRQFTGKVNVFDCGSIAIGVSASHKVTNAYNLVRFINEWASTNRTGVSKGAFAPSFDNLAFSFPPNETAKTGSVNGKHSRVTLVVALLWKALISLDQLKTGSTMNLRGKAGSPVSERSFGNVWFLYPIRFLPNMMESKFANLVALVDDDVSNWLRSGGNKTDEGLPEDTFVGTSEILGKPNIGLTYKKGYSDTPQGNHLITWKGILSQERAKQAIANKNTKRQVQKKFESLISKPYQGHGGSRKRLESKEKD
ncbi:acetyl-CoA-benzylalcohol acetyltransferase-like protein [Tanacetum coccineum]